MEYSLTCDYHQLTLVGSMVSQTKGQIIEVEQSKNIQLVSALPALDAENSVKNLYNASRDS